MRRLLHQKRVVWGAIVLLLTMMTGLSYLSGRRYQEAVSAVERAMRVASASDNVLSLLKDAETGQRGYILTADTRFLEPYDAALASLPGALRELSSLTRDDALFAHRVAQLRALVDGKIAFMAETVRLRRSDLGEVALARVRSGEGKRRMDQVRTLVRAMSRDEQAVVAERKRAAADALHGTQWQLGLGSLATVLLALLSFITVHRDVKTLQGLAEELARSEEYYRLLTEQSSDLVRLLGADGKVLYVSPSVERMLGFSLEEYMQLAPRSLLHPEEQAAALEVLAGIVAGTSSEGVSTYRIRHKSGEYLWFEVRWSARRDAAGALIDIHTVARDVTERRRAEELQTTLANELRRLSLRDELTGLYNRRGFFEVAEHVRSAARRDGRSAALVFMDVNGLKRINDEQGHEVGDLAIRDTAEVLRVTVHSADVLARLGGDEFLALMLDIGPDEVDALRALFRERADALVARHARPFRLSLSVGAAYLGADDTTPLTTLVERADAAMYEQKNARRARGGVSTRPPPVRDRD